MELWKLQRPGAAWPAKVVSSTPRCEAQNRLRPATIITSLHHLYLVGGWATPLKNTKVNWDDYSQYMGKFKKWQPNHQPDIHGTNKWQKPSDGQQGTPMALPHMALPEVLFRVIPQVTIPHNPARSRGSIVRNEFKTPSFLGEKRNEPSWKVYIYIHR